MKITFLGTGSIIPSPKSGKKPVRSYSAIFVEVGQDTLLFDIGPGTLTKMQQIGIDTRYHPRHLFITHYHIDHCQDYIGLVKGRRFDPKTGKVTVGAPLKVYGPVDLKEWNNDIFQKTKRWGYMSGNPSYGKVVHLKEVHSGLIEETSAWKVSCIPVEHYDGVAFRLDSGGKSFVYSGDMVYDENIAKLGSDADIAAIECSFSSHETLLGKHLCPEDVGKLASMGRFKKTILTHLYPQCEGREKDMVYVVEQLSHAPAQVASDFLQITL